MNDTTKHGLRAAGSALALLLVGCVPRIEVAVSKEPITINMNVKIEHEITIRADKEATQILQNSDNAVRAELGESRVATTTREQTHSQTVTAPSADTQAKKSASSDAPQ